MSKRLIDFASDHPFGEEAMVISLHGSESMSSMFDYWLTIDSPVKELAPEDIIGTAISFSLKADEAPERFFHGFVSHFQAGDVDVVESGKQTSRGYQIRLVPWVWFLSKASRCFVYLPEKEEKSIKEILDVLLTERIPSYQHIPTWWDPSRASILESRKVEHSVQYRETDLNFLLRTLEQYGVYYYFNHEKSKHTLVLSDKLDYPMCPQAEIDYPASMRRATGRGIVTGWQRSFEFVSGKWQQADYDFTKPSNQLRGNAAKDSRIAIKSNANYEVYDYTNDFIEPADGKEESVRRLQSEEHRYNTISGTSTCSAMCAGQVIRLASHNNTPSEAGKSYLLTSVVHSVSQPGRTTGAGDAEHYSNSFTCIPSEQQYRPPRLTPQPIVAGIQTATVVGPEGEEIYTDKYGRVKVQFHWDREGKYDENTSCWVRCQQSIAGNGWGFMALPRIGQEVIVQYLEGDLDRPLITGCVYNAEQAPHYTLPDEKTKTYIKTNSSTGGDGHNELMFEDKKDDERVYIHAQKNMDVRVLADSKSRIYGNRHQIIGWEKDGKKGGDQRELIYEDKHLNVKRHNYEHIEGNLSILIGDGEAESGGNVDITIENQKREVVGQGSHLTIGGERLELVQGDSSLMVEGNQDSQVKGNIAIESGPTSEIHIKSGMKLILEAGAQISLVGPGGFIDIGPSGVTIQGVLVNINSGGSAGTGQGVNTKTPEEPVKPEVVKPSMAHESTSGQKSARS